MICNTIGLTADSFESIYTTGGTEVEEVYGAIDYAQPIYAKIREITGTSPLTFTSRVAGTLTDYRISGETLQDGTPSPDMPVDVVGCGEWDSAANSYKLPVTTTNGTDTVSTPIYVGSEPLHRIGDYADYVDYSSGKIVRRIKKLVLTGGEGWTITSNGVLQIGLLGKLRQTTPLCTHYLGSNSSSWANVPDKSVTVSIKGYLAILDTIYTTAADFKSYLAAQYAAGTPVTVWYVLQEPIEEDPPVPFPALPTISGINTLSVDTTVKPSQMYIKGKIKPDGYGKLVDKNGVYILDKDGIQLTVHGQGASN